MLSFAGRLAALVCCGLAATLVARSDPYDNRHLNATGQAATAPSNTATAEEVAARGVAR